MSRACWTEESQRTVTEENVLVALETRWGPVSCVEKQKHTVNLADHQKEKKNNLGKHLTSFQAL